jgi:hypothetical protein
MAEKKGKKVAEGKKVIAELIAEAKALYKLVDKKKLKEAEDNPYDNLIALIKGMPERISMRAKASKGEKKDGEKKRGGLTIPSIISLDLLKFFEAKYPEFVIKRKVKAKDEESKDKLYREEGKTLYEILPIASWSLVTSLFFHHADDNELKSDGVYNFDSDPELKKIFTDAIAKHELARKKDKKLEKITIKGLKTTGVQKLFKHHITSMGKKDDRKKYFESRGLDEETIQAEMDDLLVKAKEFTEVRAKAAKKKKEEAKKKREEEKKKKAKAKPKSKGKKKEPEEEEEPAEEAEEEEKPEGDEGEDSAEKPEGETEEPENEGEGEKEEEEAAE